MLIKFYILVLLYYQFSRSQYAYMSFWDFSVRKSIKVNGVGQENYKIITWRTNFFYKMSFTYLISY